MKKFIIWLGLILIFSQLILVKANENISGIVFEDFYHNSDFEKNGSYDYLNTFIPGSKIQGNFKYDDSLFFKEKYSKYGRFIPNEENNKYDIILSYKAPKNICFNKDNVFSIKLPGGNLKQLLGGIGFEVNYLNYTFLTNNKNNLNNIFEYSIDNGNTWINYENELNFRNNISTNDCITDMRIKNPISKSIYYDNYIYTQGNYFVYKYSYDIPEDYKGETLIETINLKLINNETGEVSEKNFTNILKKYQSEKICKLGKLKFVVKDILKKEGTLKVEYYDKETLEKISEDRVEKGELDTEYLTEAIEIAEYSYDSVEGEETGKFIEGEKVIKYFYTKVKIAPVLKEGRLTVLYLDKETREKISEDIIEKGEIDKDYSTKAIDIANYKYDSVEGEENGKFNEGEKIVRYFYTKVKTVATPKEENIVLGSAPSIPNIEKDSRVITTENIITETPKNIDEKEESIIKESFKVEETIEEDKITFDPVSSIEINNEEIEEIYLPKVLPKTGAE